MRNEKKATLTALIVLPVNRPFLVLANLCAKSAVLLLKGERLFLRLEKARLERKG